MKFLTLIPHEGRIRFPVIQLKELSPFPRLKIDPEWTTEHPEFGPLGTYETVSRAYQISAFSRMPPRIRAQLLNYCEQLRLIERKYLAISEPEAIEWTTDQG